MLRALIPPKGKLIPFFKIHFSNNKKGRQKGGWQGMGLGRGALPRRGGSIAGKKAERPWMPFPGELSPSLLAGAGCAGAGSLPASPGAGCEGWQHLWSTAPGSELTLQGLTWCPPHQQQL